MYYCKTTMPRIAGCRQHTSSIQTIPGPNLSLHSSTGIFKISTSNSSLDIGPMTILPPNHTVTFSRST